MVEFHILHVPLRRRLQTLALLLFNWPSTLLVSLGVWACLLYVGGWPRYAMLAYTTFILLLDDAPARGADRWLYRVARPYVRNFPGWRWLRDFFPISLVKTAELDPKHTYVFGYHPHGVLSEGAFINFATNANSFDELYPGVDIRPLTLKSNLLTPFHREWAMMHGCGDASRQCVMHCLTSGKSVLLVLGGAAESMDAVPGRYDLTLLRRKGFCRLALQTGSHLVPVMSFGENDVFQPVRMGNCMRRLQQWCKAKIGFAPPVVRGRGVFNMSWGMLPHRRPIVSVVGAPIPVKATGGQPTAKQVDALHEKYVQALTKLFDAHKAKYGAAKEKLNFKA